MNSEEIEDGIDGEEDGREYLSPSEQRAAECPRAGCIFCRGIFGAPGCESLRDLSRRMMAEIGNPDLGEERRNAEVWPLLGPRPSYQAHIASAWWLHIRPFVIREAEEVVGCLDCGINQDGCWKKYGKGFQVHHLTYARMGNEHPDDLIALCPGCHAKRHGKVIDGV